MIDTFVALPFSLPYRSFINAALRQYTRNNMYVMIGENAPPLTDDEIEKILDRHAPRI